MNEGKRGVPHSIICEQLIEVVKADAPAQTGHIATLLAQLQASSTYERLKQTRDSLLAEDFMGHAAPMHELQGLASTPLQGDPSAHSLRQQEAELQQMYQRIDAYLASHRPEAAADEELEKYVEYVEQLLQASNITSEPPPTAGRH